MISEGLKKVIFKKLYKDLGNVEIINYNGNIWFIDREKKYWYFELTKDGNLWWRYSFFESFFALFSFDSPRFEPIIKDWVEEVLNHKVNTTHYRRIHRELWVEEVLNHKVNTTVAAFFSTRLKVEEVLNYKVTRLRRGIKFNVEEVLNYKVNKTSLDYDGVLFRVEEVLNHSVKEDKNTHCHYSDLPSPSAYEE